MSQEQIKADCTELATQSARMGFEQARHLATLYTASTLIISSFLRIIFPRPPKEACG